MVATDVASRGIGMRKQHPPPPFLFVSLLLHFLPLPSCDLVLPLFTRYATNARNLFQALCSFWSLP